ncbi:polysaccharide biosynthesis/export family protein [Xanthobacter autotrophicus DSM 431]|uniref:polysaccharide biosynthesis/export family protein n=1 Tax=Xanthobacter nonsaccharivorans TaxID=3119912 RepID=UPI0037275BD5
MPRVAPARLAAALLGALALAGCNLLPAAGPYSAELRNPRTQDADGVGYKLVPVTANVVRVLAQEEAEGLIGTFRNDRKPIPDVKIGIGDVVSVTLFEASSGGLFIPEEAASRDGNFVTLPDQQVDSSGDISVPYAGQVKAAGLRPEQVQNAIVAHLNNRAIEPQAVVTVKDQRSSTVTVLGEVGTPVKFPLTSSGERVLDAISRAGATPSKDYDMFVTLQRGGRDATISFRRLVREPANNIYLQPNDTLYIYARARTYLAFGASGKQGQFAFNDDTVSLSEAIGQAEGLNDGQADPQSVFLFRLEGRETLRRMGVDVSDTTEERVPTIYTVNYREPTGFLLTTKLPMHNKDVVYAANAGSVEITKFLNLVLLGATTAESMAHTDTYLYGPN